MSDEKKLPSHEDVERAFEGPGVIISRLPNSIESREAERLRSVTENLVHQIIEKTESA
jgi:hypothetical protein